MLYADPGGCPWGEGAASRIEHRLFGDSNANLDQTMMHSTRCAYGNARDEVADGSWILAKSTRANSFVKPLDGFSMSFGVQF